MGSKSLTFYPKFWGHCPEILPPCNSRTGREWTPKLGRTADQSGEHYGGASPWLACRQKHRQNGIIRHRPSGVDEEVSFPVGHRSLTDEGKATPATLLSTPGVNGNPAFGGSNMVQFSQRMQAHGIRRKFSRRGTSSMPSFLTFRRLHITFPPPRDSSHVQSRPVLFNTRLYCVWLACSSINMLR